MAKRRSEMETKKSSLYNKAVEHYQAPEDELSKELFENEKAMFSTVYGEKETEVILHFAKKYADNHRKG
jgi:hypothetical protein